MLINQLIAILILSPICSTSVIFRAEQLDGVIMKVTDADECKYIDNNACCFIDFVQLKIDFDSTQINSFTLIGRQTGTDCNGSSTLFPSKFQNPTKDISLGQFQISDDLRLQNYQFYIKFNELSSNKCQFIFTARTKSIKYTLDQYLLLELDTYKDDNGIIHLENAYKTKSEIIQFYSKLIIVGYILLIMIQL